VIDRTGRPLRFLLGGGQCFDGKAAVPLLKPLPPAKKLLADKAYDCAAFRDWVARRGTTPVIPNKINRRKPFPYNKRAYRHRNKIERMFCRLKDARRIATRYDKCAENFLSAVCLIAAIYFWLN
jgi:transposase